MYDTHARLTPQTKPIIALMGEFSAGKSTLTNLLIGQRALPTKVTATQLPPVWLTSGDGPAQAFPLDGDAYEVDLDHCPQVDVAKIHHIRVPRKAEFLELCDIIDMPGISDPRMQSDVSQRLLSQVDAVIWCSHATQAWRQSEAATWESLSEELHAKSILLLTRFDKIADEKDRLRVLKRVEKEAGAHFRSIHPIALLDAITSGRDRARWVSSGADCFLHAIMDLMVELRAGHTPQQQMTRFRPEQQPIGDTETVAKRVSPRPIHRLSPAPFVRS